MYATLYLSSIYTLCGLPTDHSRPITAAPASLAAVCVYHGGDVNMLRCHVCGATESHQALVDDVFVINGKYVLVEGNPASICTRCGEATFSRETTERIRRIVHGEAQPVRYA